jgi:hypothetical protein
MNMKRNDYHYNENYFKKHNTFGKLTVLSLGPTVKEKNYKRYCQCVCECGKELEVERFNLIRGLTKSCGCNRYPKGKISRSWKGCGDLHKTSWSRIKLDADQRHLPFSVTMEYLWELFLKQNKKCALSGEPLCFKSQSRKFDGTASLDRIDSSLGYVIGNVQWVHKDINIMKHKFSQEHFKELCRKVVNYNA